MVQFPNYFNTVNPGDGSQLLSTEPSSNKVGKFSLSALWSYFETKILNFIQPELEEKANASHSHAISDVTNLSTTIETLQTYVGNKADAAHTHTIAQVTDLQSALDSKAAAAHTHTIAQVADLQSALDSKAELVVKDYIAAEYATGTGNVSSPEEGKYYFIPPGTRPAKLYLYQDGTFVLQYPAKGTVIFVKHSVLDTTVFYIYVSRGKWSTFLDVTSGGVMGDIIYVRNLDAALKAYGTTGKYNIVLVDAIAPTEESDRPDPFAHVDHAILPEVLSLSTDAYIFSYYTLYVTGSSLSINQKLVLESDFSNLPFFAGTYGLSGFKERTAINMSSATTSSSWTWGDWSTKTYALTSALSSYVPASAFAFDDSTDKLTITIAGHVYELSATDVTPAAEE